MSTFYNSIKYIWNYMSKYWISLCFVAFFIIATTYFQVISPKYLGNSIDHLTQYVQISLSTDAKVEIVNNINEGNGLTDEQKNIISSSALDEETKALLIDSTNEELQEQALIIEELITIFDANPILNVNETNKIIEQLINGDKLTNTQIDEIEKSNLSENDKDVLINSTSSSLKNLVIINVSELLGVQNVEFYEQQIIDLVNNITSGNGMTVEDNELIAQGTMSTEEINYLQGLSKEQLQVLFAQNLGTIIGLESKAEIVLTEEQITLINESKLPPALKERLLSVTPEELFLVNNGLDSFRVNQNLADEKYDEFQMSVFKLLIAYVLLMITNFLYTIIMVQISGKTTREMRNGLFKKIQRLSIRFFDSSEDGDLLSRFVNDIDNISTALNQSVTQSLSQGAMLFGIVYIMFRDDESYYTIGSITIENFLTITMIAFAIFAILISLSIVKKAQYYVSRQQKRLGELNSFVDERIQGQNIVKSYNLEDETIEKFEEYNKVLRDTSTKGQIYSGILMPIMNGIGYINLGVLVFVGSLFVANGTGGMTVGILVAFIQYSQRFFQPLAQIVSQYNIIQLGLSGSARIHEIHEVPEDVVNSENAKPVNGIKGKVVLKDVTFGYNPEVPILKNINIEVEKGQMVALVGPTGSGKTTVMNVLNRFYDIDSGDILYDNISIKDITLETLRKNIGIVLQESVLFSGTISQNIGYGKQDATQDEIINAAKQANLHEFIMSLEKGYETEISNSTSSFSTGQKQLMSIARTMLTDPDLLILDEATSNVDTVTEEKIQKAMNNVISGRTSFVIAHRLKTILDADVIVVLKDGEIIEQGSHKELLSENGFYSELYHNQFVTKQAK